MMPSLLGVTHPTYQTDILLDDLSRQMAASQAARRLSRGSNGQRAGNAMRIAKPSSANNSPRSSIMLGRRRTLMNDGNLARRRQQALDQVNMAVYETEYAESQSRSTSRPVSWHPSSYHQQPQIPVHQSVYQYPFPTTTTSFNDQEMYSSYQQFPSTPAAYSCNTSPSSTFSPLALPFSAFDPPPFLPAESWVLPQQPALGSVSSSSDSNNSYVEPFPSLSSDSTEAASSSAIMQWNSFAMHGFNSTSPPTPETLPQSQQPQPAMSSDEAIPYQSLDEPEDEGEILVGMGLYDAPEKYESTPQLDAYRSTLSLLGTPYRGQEATGKGLKLEESWQPPDSDDEADDDGDEDADGEDQEDDAKSTQVEARNETEVSTWI